MFQGNFRLRLKAVVHGNVRLSLKSDVLSNPHYPSFAAFLAL